MSSPPAIPTSPLTHRIALIIGSSHSSKLTRGRRGRGAAAAFTRATCASSSAT
jgi:hypothetical protein